MKRKTRNSPPSRSAPTSSNRSTPTLPFNYTSIALLGGVFILGVGIGIGFSSTANTSVENVASREAIDRAAPNPEICVKFGASAIAMDTRVFVTLNPFNVYVSQPKMQPGCVLRQNNWAILEQRKLLPPELSRECRQRLNTFGFTGNLEGSPQISCIYQNDAAQNLFLQQSGERPKPGETERF